MGLTMAYKTYRRDDWFYLVRRKLASWLIGPNRLALFMPQADIDRAQKALYDQMDDETLAAYTRWYLRWVEDVQEDLASRDDMPLSIFTQVHGVLSLVRHAMATNAGELTITQACTVNGESAGVWQATLKQMPDDYDFGEPGVKRVMDGDKLVQVTTNLDLRKKD